MKAKTLKPLTGDYGTVKKGEEIEVTETRFKELKNAGLVEEVKETKTESKQKESKPAAERKTKEEKATKTTKQDK